MSEKRVDPEDGVAYTFDELKAFYAGKYKKKAVLAYWEDTCTPVKKRGKGKAKAKAEPEPKAKAKSKAKATAKEKAKAKVKAKPKPKEALKFSTGYWNIRGLAAPMRMILEYAGADYTDAQYELADLGDGKYDNSSWMKDAKPPLMEKNALMNLPYVTCGDQVVTQSNAVYLFLGQKLRMNGRGAGITSNNEILCEVMDLRNEVIDIVYPFKGVGKDGWAAACKKHMEGNAKGHYTKFEGYLKQKDTPFFSGPKICTGDFHVWEMLDQHELMAKDVGAPSPMEGYPLLSAFYTRVKELPQLEKYFASDAYKLPCNNKMANFK